MKRGSIVERIKQWVAGIGFRLFIWGNDTTEEQYWEEIYQQERVFKQHKSLKHLN